jgi:MSHA biogenesis protein MshP
MKIIQRGFSIVSAIFLLVVLAFLGVAMVSFSTSQQQSQAMDVMGSRAYHAAQAGIEWAAYYITKEPVNAPAAWAGCVPVTPVALAGDLAPFSPVAVSCVAASSVEGASTIWIYDVTATATPTGAAPGAPNYIERSVTARLAR